MERKIPFSPPDISELEIEEVCEALRSGWITTGPRTKLLERRLAAYIETGRTNVDCENKEAIEKYSNRVVCLNSATAAEELNLRILGVKEGDDDGDDDGDGDGDGDDDGDGDGCIIGLTRKMPDAA